MSKHKEQFEKNEFSLTLSVSKETVGSKEEGRYKTEFEIRKDISTDHETLRTLFRSHLQSTNIWALGNKGHCGKNNYSGMTGVMLDLDGGATIEEIEERCKPYHYILYTSTSHKTIKDDQGKLIEKFRVILPFALGKYNTYTTLEQHEVAYKAVKNEFPEIDPSCFDAGRKFYPSTGDLQEFILKVHVGQGYFTPNLNGYLHDQVAFGTKKVPPFSLDTPVYDSNTEQLKIKDITEKTIIFCPFCDPKERGNPNSPNAFVDINVKGVPYIFCSSCKSRGKGVSKSGIYNLDKDTSYKLETENGEGFVFRDILKDKFYLGENSKRTGAYNYNPITKQNIKNALIERDITIPESYPEAEFIYDFKSDTRFDLAKGFVNRYIAPAILTKTFPPKLRPGIPKHIKLLTLHITGGDEKVYDSLVNHLAYMVQNRDKVRVAFLFQGTQGTGKGMWLNNILAPIFGRNYCTSLKQDAFLKEFNTFLESNFCILIDEIEANFTDNGNKLVRVLKHNVTEKHISIEGKGVDMKGGINNANLFLATNKPFGVRLEPSDRRFIIGARQENKVYEKDWWLGDDEMVEKLSGELEEFVCYLKQFKVQKEIINRIVENTARDELIDLSKTHSALFFEAVCEGNYSWLKDNIQKRKIYDGYQEYEKAQEILSTIRASSKVKRDDLRLLYTNIVGIDITPTKFTQTCKLHNVKVEQCYIDGENLQGVKISWPLSELKAYKEQSNINGKDREVIAAREAKGQLQVIS